MPPASTPANYGAKHLSKLKRFLTTLQQFASDISPEIGDVVRNLVLSLVVWTYSRLDNPVFIFNIDFL